MYPLTLTDGTIINLLYCQSLLPYSDGTYRIVWNNGDFLDLRGNDATILTNYLTKNGIAVVRTLVRPPY